MTGNNQSSLHQVDWSQLPKPYDDGAANHLVGMPFPSLAIPSTKGTPINIAEQTGRVVMFIFPMTGRPDQELPKNWDMIPGARGCTPQACSFRDLNKDFLNAGVDHVFGLSTQTSEYQSEAAERLHLPFPLLSDANLALSDILKLPTLKVADMTLLRRLTLVVKDGLIEKVWYPVFPPDENANNVLEWLQRTS